jgi:two-component system sensor histidine kinase UhpB
MIAMCAYRVSLIPAAGLFDVARTHQFATARRYGKWEIVETPELKQAKADLSRMNEELEARILERTGELAAKNQELTREVAERTAAEERLRDNSRVIHDMSAHLVEMEEAARRTLSRELHDRIGQILAALNVNLTIIRDQISGDLRDRIVPRIDDSLSLLEETGTRVQDMIADLRPPVLDDYGLLAALRWYGKKFTSRTGITVRVRGKEMSPRPDPKVETTLFRITQEALTNVSKHAKAANVAVIVRSDDSSLCLSIHDDGIGIHPSERTESGERPGWGLVTMTERAESLGGSFRIGSRPAGGTRVVVKVPR